MKRDPENVSKFTSALPRAEISASREGAKFKSEMMNVSRKVHFLQGQSGQVKERLVNTAKP